jgi:DNA adenine methylase
MSMTVLPPAVPPLKTQLLKWVGNKQRFAHEIASFFPPLESGTYFEPFLGSAAVLGTIAPKKAIGSDAFKPLMGIWQTLKSDPELLINWYETRWKRFNQSKDGKKIYEEIKASFNEDPNPADFLFLTRSCYGGVVRFRKLDGYMSTPMGPHDPITPESFRKRVEIWYPRIKGTKFMNIDYKEAFEMARAGDVIYCDPPYVDSQGILYGAQSFRLGNLMDSIQEAKSKGVYVALSIDGSKRSDTHQIDIELPKDLFEVEASVNIGRSMLKRFQSLGETLEGEVVQDRLLLTHSPI